MNMGYGLDDFTGNIRCRKCGHRFFKGLKGSRTVCPQCGDVKDGSSASSSDISRAKERGDELEL
jgi:uncharacterized Zn finger protein (UPF0148 family)